jgi:hypothetical protein
LESRVHDLLARPDEQRLREYKYRFSQSVVFGVPVIALQYFGGRLGPVDSERWVSLLQSLLAGWIVYVNLGMLFEGILLLKHRVTADLVVAAIAVAVYLASLVSAGFGVVTSRLLYPLLFHVCVIVLAVWTGARWWQFARRNGGIGR